MKIINEIGLPYKVIGEIIDQVIELNPADTIYYGKVETTTFEYKGEKYRIQIRYLKSYVEWRFYE